MVETNRRLNLFYTKRKLTFFHSESSLNVSFQIKNCLNNINDIRHTNTKNYVATNKLNTVKNM